MAAGPPPTPAPPRSLPAAAREEEARRRDYRVLEPEQCLWSLEEDVDAAGERCKLLVLTLARPEPTEEEVTWKKGGGGWWGLGRGGQQQHGSGGAWEPARPTGRRSCPALAAPAGKRQDNRVVPRPGSLHQKGWRFFADDEDLHGLEDILQVGGNCP